MAAIDKIYGTTAEYDQFHSWCASNKKDALKYFYPRDGYKNNLDRPITNLPLNIDKWLLEICTITWVVVRIKEQY
jgi:hypothetical protein